MTLQTFVDQLNFFVKKIDVYCQVYDMRKEKNPKIENRASNTTENWFYNYSGEWVSVKRNKIKT